MVLQSDYIVINFAEKQSEPFLTEEAREAPQSIYSTKEGPK